MTTPYDDLDKLFLILTTKVKRELNNTRLKVTIKSKVTYSDVKKEVNRSFNKIYDELFLMFLILAKNIYPEVTKNDIKVWLEEFYSLTGYVFQNEFNRKADRYAETLMANKDNLNSSNMMSAQNGATRVLLKQIEEYGVFIVDHALLLKYKEQGALKVQWHTQDDNRVCVECLSRDKKVYDIDKVPEKSHYGCRCYIELVKGETNAIRIDGDKPNNQKSR